MGHSKIKGVFLAAPDGFRIRYVFGAGRREQYEKVLDLCPELICSHLRSAAGTDSMML